MIDISFNKNIKHLLNYFSKLLVGLARFSFMSNDLITNR